MEKEKFEGYRKLWKLEWHDMVTKLLKPMSRLRLTAEDEEIIKKIASKL